MNWIDPGYDLVWDKSPPIAREMSNFKSSVDNHVFVTKSGHRDVGGWCRFGSPIGRNPNNG